MSLQQGLTPEDTIIIINDRTSYETLRWMKENTQATFQTKDITPLDELRKNHAYPQYHPVVANACQDLMEILIETVNLIHQKLYICVKMIICMLITHYTV